MRTEHCGVTASHAPHVFEGRLGLGQRGALSCPGTQYGGGLSSQLGDRDFTKRLQRRISEDKPILDRLAQLESAESRDAMLTLAQLVALPLGMFIGANRYDTDDQHVLHLWTDGGQSFDVMWPKRTLPVAVEQPPEDEDGCTCPPIVGSRLRHWSGCPVGQPDTCEHGEEGPHDRYDGYIYLGRCPGPVPRASQTSESWDERLQQFPDSQDIAKARDVAAAVLGAITKEAGPQ